MFELLFKASLFERRACPEESGGLPRRKRRSAPKKAAVCPEESGGLSHSGGRNTGSIGVIPASAKG